MGKQIFLSHQFICFVWLFSKNGIRTLFLCSSKFGDELSIGAKNFFCFLFPSFLYFRSVDTNTTKTHNLLYNCQAYKKMLSVIFLLINIIFFFTLHAILSSPYSAWAFIKQQILRQRVGLGGGRIVFSLEFPIVLLYNIIFLFGWRTTSWTCFFRRKQLFLCLLSIITRCLTLCQSFYILQLYIHMSQIVIYHFLFSSLGDGLVGKKTSSSLTVL